MKAARKAILIMCVAVVLSGLGSTIFLDHYFYRTRPREPEPQFGRLYPRAIHGGTVVYLTRTETLPFDYFYVLGVLSGIAAILESRWKVFHNLHADLPNKLS